MAGIDGVKGHSHNVLPQGRLHQFQWQRNYYERVIRDEAELNSIRQSISSPK
jgi:hypothetical protein